MRRSQAMPVAGAVLAVALACSGGTGAPPAGAAPRPAAPRPPVPPEIDGKTPLPDPLPDVAAKVNGTDVPMWLVKRLAERALASGSLTADQKPFAYRQSLNQYVIRELLFQEATAQGLAADQARLDEAENADRSQYKTPADFQATLAQQGLTEATYKLELRIQHTVNALVTKTHESVGANSVTDDELERYYEERPAEFTSRDRIRAAHILVRVPAGSTPAVKNTARKKAEGLLAEINAGGDFAELAKKASQDPASAPRGGEMQPFGRGQMGPELAALENALYTLKPGALGEAVVESPAGYHVVKLLETLPDEVVPLETVKEQLRHHILQQKRHEALQGLVEGLRAKAKIETFL